MNGPNEKQIFEFDEYGELTAEDQAFEQELVRAMRHRAEPPAGFADTIMGRAEAGDRPPARVVAMPGRWKAAQTWAAGAIAAGLVVGLGIQTAHRHHERTEATHQFDVATQIEQQTLERTREKLARQGISLEQ